MTTGISLETKSLMKSSVSLPAVPFPIEINSTEYLSIIFFTAAFASASFF